jgi:nucleoporin SEH1
MLVIYENEEPEHLDSWQDIDKVTVCEKPPRGDETSFKLAFDPNLEPCYAALRQGVPRDALSLVVASMNKATIWRTKEISHSVTLGSSTSKVLYLAAELKGHGGLVRDVTWAPGNVRGFDIVATACKDGFIRVFEIHTPPKSGKELRSKDYSKIPDNAVVQSQRATENGTRNVPSGIGAGLAGTRSALRPEKGEGEVVHVVKEVAKLEANRTPVWTVDFDADGLLLGSTGDDGKLMLWRRQPNGNWCRSSELAMVRQVVG